MLGRVVYFPKTWVVAKRASTCMVNMSMLTNYPCTIISKVTNLMSAMGTHQFLHSEMSPPGIEVLIEKLLPEIFVRLGKQNLSKRRGKVAFVQRKCTVTSSVSVPFLCATYN